MMSDWNPRMVTRDGEEIEPSDHLAGSWDREPGQQQSVPAPADARALRRERLEDATPDIEDDESVDGYLCPDCGREYDSREAQADCIREHAREMADRLEEVGDGWPVRQRAMIDPRINALLLVAIAVIATVVSMGVVYL